MRRLLSRIEHRPLYARGACKDRPVPKKPDSGARRARKDGPGYTGRMNDNFGELKARVRRLNELLTGDGGRILANLDFARAVSHAHRLVRDGDRTREPSAVLRAAVEKAEILGRGIR